MFIDFRYQPFVRCAVDIVSAGSEAQLLDIPLIETRRSSSLNKTRCGKIFGVLEKKKK